MFQREPIELTESLLSTILKQKYVSFLDCNTQVEDDEESIIGINPKYTFISNNNHIIVSSDETPIIHTNENVFDIVQSYIKPCKTDADKKGFNTGFIGMFTYESAKHFQDFNWLNSDTYPEVLGGIYDRYIIINHKESQAYFVSSTLYNREHVSFKSIVDQFIKGNEVFNIVSKIDCPKKELYEKQVKRILAYIKQGDVYQVNFSRSYSVLVQGCLSTLYHHLRIASPAPYSAYINFGTYHILSASPELFFKKNQETEMITTKPIKGTIARGDTQSNDRKQKEQLQNSTKDQAELLMIVDLERNDLNKICKTGSVHVTELRAIESYQHVHHGVASIKGELKENIRFSQIMEALFPGGSITGAPKKRAMQIINECEGTQRGPYTGSIGFISGNGDMTFNIAIRTLYSKGNTLFFHAGGGIVADSNCDLEWEECNIKARGMIASLSGVSKNRILV